MTKSNLWKAVGAFLVAPALACSSASSPTSDTPAASVSGTSDAGAASDAGAWDVTLDPTLSADPDVASIATLTMDSFTVAPGAEVYKCQDFANPFAGQQVDIKAYELHMAPGSHHMFAFYKANATNGKLGDCPQGGLEFGAFTFTSQTPHAIGTYPTGVGATIPTTMGFHLNAHYINTSDAPLTGHVTISMFISKAGLVTQHAGVIYDSQNGITVPPTGMPSTTTATCTLPQDVNLLDTSSHMHQRATNFTMVSGDTTLFQTDNWDAPTPAVFSPPLLLKAGAQMTWSCTYVNDTGSWLTFGESARTNVMCISVSAFYPVQDINNPVIQCQK